MKREIKFRVWINDLNEDLGGKMYLPYRFADLLLRISGELELQYDVAEDSGLIPVQDAIVMQYTGLKDKNGKEIYEGDILDYTNNKKNWNSPTKYYVVGFKNGSYVANGYNGEFTISPNLSVRQWDVVGNIYENPELL